MKAPSKSISKVIPEEYDEDNNENRGELSSPAPRKIDKKLKFYAPDCINYEKFLPRLPHLRHVRGSKEKVQFTTFKEIADVAQQIFEHHRSFFRFTAQINIAAHYIGMRILEEIYITQNKKPQNKLSELLERYEPLYQIYDDIKIVKEKVQTLIEKYSQNLMTKSELDDHIKMYLEVFAGDDNNLQKIAKIIDEMVSDEEVTRTKERYKDRERKRKHRLYEAQAKGIKEVR